MRIESSCMVTFAWLFLPPSWQSLTAGRMRPPHVRHFAGWLLGVRLQPVSGAEDTLAATI
jgi:hypothetical protein